jgi:2,5-diamino-6-(ribosylamino)-4(3H)-pyrimidinone 5'-phosphate reductase
VDQRPRVVVCVSATADGRVALNREQVLMAEPTGSIWAGLAPPSMEHQLAARDAELDRRYQPGAVLEGSGTFVTDAAGSLDDLPAVTGDPDELYTDFLVPDIVDRPAPPHRWFAVVDGRGRVRWQYKSSGDFDVLVLVARRTPAEYLAYLRAERICYLVAGDERVDLDAALRRMAIRLQVTCVQSTAGGGLNGALLRAGLVDELDLTLMPALAGGLGTPSIIDGPALGIGEHPTKLRLLSVYAETDGTVRLRYEVQPGSAGKSGAKSDGEPEPTVR